MEEILKKLKTTYSDKGLPSRVLEVYANKIAKTAETEEEQDKAIKDLEDDLTIFQSLSDQNRTLVSENQKLIKKLSKQGAENQTEPKTPKETSKPDGGENSQLIEMMMKMNERLDSLQREKTQKTNKEKLTEKLKQLGVREQFYKPFTDREFENDEQIDEFASLLKKQEDEFLQSINYEKLKNNSQPNLGQKKDLTEEEAKAEADAILSSRFKNYQKTEK